MQTRFFPASKLVLMLLLATIPTSSFATTLCQQLLTQNTRVNSPVLPFGSKFQAWSPGSNLPDHQQSLGALEFYSPEIGSFAVQSISGLSKAESSEKSRRLSRLLAMIPFAGFVDEAEFKSLLDSQPIPERLKTELSAPGVVHLVKRLPDHYFLFDALSSPEHLRELLNREALEHLLQSLDQVEAMFYRLHLTVESPILTVTENGEVLLLNFENVRDRNFKERRLRLLRERGIVEQALQLP